MGTNASNKSVASKIVAVLLAALMLISVMPMSAFAGSINDGKITVDGFTLMGECDPYGYDEGNLDLTGLAVEITYRYDNEINEYKDRAIYRTAIIAFGDSEDVELPENVDVDDVTFVDNYKDWVDALDDYSVDCNVSEYDWTADEDHIKYLDMNDNGKEIVFTYAKDSSKNFETGIYLTVIPDLWTSAESVNHIDGGADYIIVADGNKVITSNTVETKSLDGYAGDLSLAVVEVTADTANKEITNISGQLEDKDIDLDEALWYADVIMEEDGTYNVWWESVATDELMSAEEVLSATSKYTEWPLVTGEEDDEDDGFELNDFYLEYSNKGSVMYVVNEVNYVSESDASAEEEDDEYADIDDDKIEKVYVAVADGYAYLTTDETKAAKIDIYKACGHLTVEGVEIVKDPAKMAYTEGEEFEIEGMMINVTLSDGTVVCITDDLFDSFEEYFDIYVDYEGYELSVADNDQPYYVSVNGAYDYSDNHISVTKKGSFGAEIPEGDLVDGYYVIAWYDFDMGQRAASDEEEFVKNTVYGPAFILDADDKNVVTRWDELSDYSFGTIGYGVAGIRNNALGNFYLDTDMANDLSDSMIWNVKASGNYYTIQEASTGLYLNRTALTYRDLHAIEQIEGRVDTDEADEIIASAKLITLGEYDATASLWKIDGTVDASIESAGLKGTNDNEYLVWGNPDLRYAFCATSDCEDTYGDNFYFFAVEDITPAKIEVVDQPHATYNSGDALDLSDLAVKITYSNGVAPVVVFVDDFNTYGITVNYDDGALLSGSDNGKSVVVTLGNLTASTIALTVTDSKADTAIVRLGGADRYETATIIASSYVTALGTAYENVAVLTSGVNYPDALAGATLATALKAPIVLTKADALVGTTKTFLTENAVKTVYVIGGTSAVSADVEATLKAMGITVVRIAGTDRVETSVAVAKKLAEIKGAADTVILTNGSNFADALSVSSAAAQLGLPVVYVNGVLSETVKTFITESKATKAVILGGELAVSAETEAAVKAMGLSVERIAGADRYETSTAIAAYFADCYTGAAVTFATGKDFPDALAGGVYAAYVGAPVVLLDNGYANADAALYTAGLDLTNVYVFGGTAALSDATINAALLK